eukprot:m.16745 g.16745  ORF g.16745 m.16745 type:complete len:247 (+) comp11021_c0_seq4:3049-3789(+)
MVSLVWLCGNLPLSWLCVPSTTVVADVPDFKVVCRDTITGLSIDPSTVAPIHAYTLAVSVESVVVIDACDSDFDTILTISNSTWSDVSDDSPECGLLQSRLNLLLTPGQYEVNISGFLTDGIQSTGYYTIVVDCTPSSTGPESTARGAAYTTGDTSAQPASTSVASSTEAPLGSTASNSGGGMSAGMKFFIVLIVCGAGAGAAYVYYRVVHVGRGRTHASYSNPGFAREGGGEVLLMNEVDERSWA